MRAFHYLIFSILLFTFLACSNTEQSQEEVTKKKTYSHHSEWSKNAVTYELNIRQFSDEGTFNAIIPQLDRLKDMGIDIIWLMPVHPIGEENRKGELGSYYSVKDYTDVNPNYGTMQDFKTLVDSIHSKGMFVIIDWVANHSAWDNPWVTEHPDWYTLDSTGSMIPPIGTDWSDVVDLNYDNPGLRKGMIGALKFWLDSCNIDGYRCDVADWVPTEFWEEARLSLDSIKPDLFMLAEAENPKLHNAAFDMTYGWELHHISNEIAKDSMNFDDLENYMAKEDTNFSAEAYRLNFTSNHDENSWNGTVFERYGDNYKNWAVAMATIDGMPLLYSGQESKMNERLAFFKKDTINWQDYPLHDFYRQLFQLKETHEAVWNGKFGGSFERITNNKAESVFSFIRKKGDDTVMVIINFSGQAEDVVLKNSPGDSFKDYFSTIDGTYSGTDTLNMEPNSFKVFVSN